MGYYTNYTLKAQCLQPNELQAVLGESGPDFPAELEKIVGYDSLGDSCKWYEHENDMLSLAMTFPGYSFTLHGEGEQSGDIWVKTFFRGKMHVAKAQITFEPVPKDFFTHSANPTPSPNT